MIIHVKKRDSPYVQIDKRPLEDDRLSYKARGLLAYLLSKPPDWQVWVRDLVNRSQKDGETAVRSAIKELKENGYIEEKQPRRDDGTFGPVEYWVYEIPRGGFPQAEKSKADEPKAENPPAENQGHTNNDSTKNHNTDNEENKKESAFPENPDPAPEAREERTDGSVIISGQEESKADPVIESIVSDAQTKPDYLPVAAGCLAEREKAGGAWTAPPPAGGGDAAARAGIVALAEAKGSRPPREDSGGYIQQLEKFGEPLKDQGERDPEVAALAAQMFVEEKPAMANPYYSSFRGDYGDFLGRAREILDKQRAKPPPGEYEPVYGSAPEPLVEDDGDCPVGAAIKGEIQLQMTKATFDTWVKSASFVCDDGVLTVTAPDAMVRDWLDSHLRQIIERTAVGVLGRAVEVRFEAAGAPEEI